MPLVATASDPDKNALTVKWWQYTDADTYPGAVSLLSSEMLTTTFQVPTGATIGQTSHVLIQVAASGTPALTSFQRVIVTVTARWPTLAPRAFARMNYTNQSLRAHANRKFTCDIFAAE